MRLLILTIIVTTLNLCLCDKVEVKIKQGALLGSVETTLFRKQNYYSFKGIPFAEKPTGELRFQPPKPLENWDGTYEAFEKKPTCVQVNSRIRKFVPMGVSGSEDCLYINVFTPDTAGSVPVIVFDYNDNFRAGFNSSDTYAPDFLIEEGILVVTISHRLGIFGYLTTEDDVIPANAGLKDFVLGLEWVKDNIEHFGGDPSKVTIMGNRGGAAIVDILLYSEKAKGLFSAAILQSGTALEAMYFFKNPREKAFKLGEFLDIKTDDSKTLLEGLQEVEVEKMLDNEIQVLNDDYTKINQISSFPYAPTIEYNREDGVITSLPEKGKIINDVPIIIGFNSREGLDLISHFIIEPRLLTNLAEDNILMFPLRMGYRFDRDSAKYKEATKEILEYYFEDKSLHYGNILEYSVYVQDVLQNYALDLEARKIAESLTSPVFYYVFDFRGQLNEISQYLATKARFNIENYGATVGDELCFLVLCSRIKGTYQQLLQLPSEQHDVKVLKRMVRMWSNFAKTRNPTPKEDILLKGFTWEPLSKNPANNYLHITKKLVMKTDPLGERKKFWDEFLDRYSQLAVDGVVTDDKSRDEL